MRTLADVIDEAWDLNADVDPEGLVAFRGLVADAKRACTDVLGRIDAKLAEALGRGTHNVGSNEVRVSKAAPVRSAWDIEELLRVIRDTVVTVAKAKAIRYALKLDDTPPPVPGENDDDLLPFDEVLQLIWNLGPPRTTALKELGINGDNFCHVEKKPKVQVI